MHILFLTLEFADPIFSGNGIWARSLVRGLLRQSADLRITVISGSPEGAEDTVDWPERLTADWGGRLCVYRVPLPTWGRLDRACCWEAFASGAPKALLGLSQPLSGTFDLVMGLDWHSLLALEAVEQAHPAALPPFVFLNVRVFSANGGLSEDDRRFYTDLESRSVARAARVIAQTDRDVKALSALGAASAAPRVNNATCALHCPLREDLRIMAGDAAATGIDRRHLVCIARLSPEKHVEAFVSMVEALASELAASDTVPLLIGAPSSPPEYGDELVCRLLAACPSAEYRGFGPPEALAGVYRSSKLNFHGAFQEPYGMSLIEAAAFGTPSLFNEDGIGAGERLRHEKGEAFAVRMDDPVAVAEQVREVLSQPEKLREVGSNAQAQALAWSEADFAAAVLLELRAVSSS